jgi:hypothetical protein
MYDDGELTAEEIAGVVGVARPTLYENLSACKDGGDCVMVAYRNTRPGKVDPDTNRRYGETRQSEAVQLEADRKWWNVTPAREARLRAWSTWSTAPCRHPVQGPQPGQDRPAGIRRADRVYGHPVDLHRKPP